MHLNVGFNVSNCRVHRLKHMSTTINVIVKVSAHVLYEQTIVTAVKSWVEFRQTRKRCFKCTVVRMPGFHMEIAYDHYLRLGH